MVTYLPEFEGNEIQYKTQLLHDESIGWLYKQRINKYIDITPEN
jgi:hypothetical protein